LVELLVVIAVIALLVAIFIPVAGAARERGQRAVCLSNLRQLTLAWTAYADEHDGDLVMGCPGFDEGSAGGIRWRIKGWVGSAFTFPESRSALIQDPDKGALWRWIQDIDIYRCPRAGLDQAITYAIVAAANGITVEGTYLRGAWGPTTFGKRVGNTVLRLTRLTDIVSPGAAQRAVFIDQAHTPGGADFNVLYLDPKWHYSEPPIHHADGVTISMADGHAEYWKWKGRETVEMPRQAFSIRGVRVETLAEDYEPQTADGLYDLERLQRATWGRLGYSTEQTP
jgi:prepilin-type processing-associated H-X9-DG protein